MMIQDYDALNIISSLTCGCVDLVVNCYLSCGDKITTLICISFLFFFWGI